MFSIPFFGSAAHAVDESRDHLWYVDKVMPCVTIARWLSVDNFLFL